MSDFRLRPSDSRLRVLTYHRVGAAPAGGTLRPSVISATPEVFREQMRHLARHYNVLDVRDVLSALRRRRPLPANAVLVTFDDAYRDFGEVAWPILRRLGLPATLFVPTAYPDQDREFWWDRLHRAVAETECRAVQGFSPEPFPLDTPQARRTSLRLMQRLLKSIPHDEAMARVDAACRKLVSDDGRASAGPPPVLGWDQLRELSADGVALAPHTRTHPALPQMRPDEARAEIVGAKEDLRREVGPVLPVFAFPFGAHDDRVVRQVREEGFELAFTCGEGHNMLGTIDPLRLRRTGITPRTTPALFRLRLHGWFSHVDRWRRRRRPLIVDALRRPRAIPQLEEIPR